MVSLLRLEEDEVTTMSLDEEIREAEKKEDDSSTSSEKESSVA